jgi:diguanylate cyclase (GGDEF)-like protein/PAS domain S-box-containing protein
LKKLLIVDNSVVIINILKDLFSKKNNFNVYTAKTLKEVDALIKKEEFFVVISNTVLPDALNGELLETLKANDIPTIILSSKVDNDLSHASTNLNVIDYVLKDSIYGLEYIYNLVELLVFIKSLNVLVVRESRDKSLRIKYILESLFLNVKLATNGSDALDIIENNADISLLICDYDVPEINGLELTRKLRKSDKYSNLPILILSDEVNNDLKIKLYKIGINDFIPKPVLEEELKAKVIKLFLNTKQVEEINTFNKIFDDNIISSSTDTKGVIKSVSFAFSKISGYTKDELIGKHHNIVRHPDMPSSIYKDMWGTIKENKKWKGEIKNLRKDGSSYWVSSVIEPIFDKQKNKIGYYAVRQDITDKKRIYELSITDGLTSLFNRRYFNDIAKSMIDKTVRNNELFGFMILDIDNFKKYNDTYGHQEGDNVLINLSISLKATFKRSDDLIFRLGGEEFGVLFNAKTKDDIITLSNLAKENIKALNIEHKKNEDYGVVTASFGLIIIEVNKINKDYKLDDIYKQADDQLYVAKENGRNTVKYKII